jgi:transcriptional regulator with XRE-family HTH domain
MSIMSDNEPVRTTLARLREQAKLTQTQLAERLLFTPSRLSRLESGDIELTTEAAQQIAVQIATESARAFAEYLGQDWRATERPSFSHANRDYLWKAEVALIRIRTIEETPELKNAFVRQIRSIREALERAADQLRSTEHSVVLIGPPEVGKTTVLCATTGLRRHEAEGNLDCQMALQTGGGRVTLGEVHVRSGSDFTISVDPCSEEDLQQFVSEFCDDLLRMQAKGESHGQDGYGISAEVDRAIRNMGGLTIKRTKLPNGQVQRDDLAQELAKEFPQKEDLLVQVLTRMELPRRNKTSVTFPRDSTRSGLDWVSKTAAEINYGKHAEFSIPRRVEITVPTRILGTDDLDIRIIDTRGIDEPSVPRRDLQAYLDDDRCVVVLCSRFGDAPTGATLSVLERAIAGGRKDALLERGLLLVLPRDHEDITLRDSSTGDWVSSPQDGREIKLSHILTTLLHHGCPELPVQFLNVQVEEDCQRLRENILGRIREMRRQKENEIDVLVGAIDRMITNQKTEEARAVFTAATKSLRIWCAANRQLPPPSGQPSDALLGEMSGLRYASSLRASVNRRGNWHNFDYWHALGFGTRSETVVRTATQVNELKILINAALRDDEYEVSHHFLRFFLAGFDKAVADLYEWAQALGESAYKGQLTQDLQYWSTCQGRWGGGTGYKDDIGRWTLDWFRDEGRQAREDFIETEINRRWEEMLARFHDVLSSGPEQAGICPDANGLASDADLAISA